jgi:hypothetical protein
MVLFTMGCPKDGMPYYPVLKVECAKNFRDPK